MELSRFTKNKDGIYEGKIQGLGLSSIMVQSQMATSRENKTYYRLIAQYPSGDRYEVGSMWPKIKDGLEYLSVSLDSPFFPEPIHAALFSDKDNPNVFRFVWQRQKPAAKAKATHGVTQTNLEQLELASVTTGTTELRNTQTAVDSGAKQPQTKRGLIGMQAKL